MKAMILAAGYGTRLKPLTDELPKPLVDYDGKPMIVNAINYLISYGVKSILINAHYHSEKMIEFFNNYNSGCEINITVEKEILGTGGGILNAIKYLSGEDFFIVMNTDVVTDLKLIDIINFHQMRSPFATLAVQDRPTKRKLEFDDDMNLIGKANGRSRLKNCFAFNGIHVISREIFSAGYEVKFSGILEIYFEEVLKGKTIKGFDCRSCTFKDLGTVENLKS